MKRNRADVVVVGAGIIGCSIARALALRGLDVIALDRGVPGRQASWAAAGMLSPVGEAGIEGHALAFSEAGLHMYASLADTLRNETGIDIEYRTDGRLHVSLGDADDELRAIAASPAAARFDISTIDAAAACALEPSLSDRITSALLIRRDHRVNPRLLAQAVRAAAVAADADIRSSRHVAALDVRAGAVAGVTLASGERIGAGHVVIAAGAWSARIDGIPRTLPVYPVRGQMFAVDAADDAAVRHVIFTRTCYIVPRDDGRLLVGATMEDVGFAEGPTPRGIQGLIAAATAVMPAIADMPLVEAWASFRPGTPDGLPILGADPDLPGLIYATGHFRNGILLAPITAASVTALITGDGLPVPLDAFSATRFST